MATEEDLKKAEADEEAEGTPGDEAAPESAPPDEAASSEEPSAAEAEDDEDEGELAPVQLGYQRYVYAAYMAFAMLIGLLVAKLSHTAWYRLGQWKPQLGEPQDELLFPIAGAIGIGVALYYWRKTATREYVNEVAEELSKVTWPSRKEVTNSTTVVVLTTLFATAFFALMDRFWGFVTDHIYSF